MSYCRLEDSWPSIELSSTEQNPATLTLNSRSTHSEGEAQRHENCSNILPSIHLNLDLPGFAGYLPTYWPGQHITGEVKIDLKEPMTITHFRIALFGNVQVYGERPGQPLNNGLFDHCRNEQLINSGLKITNKTQRRGSNDTSAPADLFMHSPQRALDNKSTLSTCRLDDVYSVRHGHAGNAECAPIRRSTITTNTTAAACAAIGVKTDEALSSGTKHKKQQRKKTQEDRHIEKLIREVATITQDDSNSSDGILDNFIEIPTTKHRKGNATTSSHFDLKANSYRTRFSIRVPTSRRLAGSFDHPHYPITHRIIAVMKCRPIAAADNKAYSLQEEQQQQQQQPELTCYSTVKICLEPNISIQSEMYQARVQTDPVYLYMHGHSVFYSRMLSTSATVSTWMHKILHTKQRRSSAISITTKQQQQAQSEPPITSSPSLATTPLSSYLTTYAVLPQKAFVRSQFIPIEVVFANHTFPQFSITAVKITVSFLRRIFMACSINEEVETKVIATQCVEFYQKAKVAEETTGDDTWLNSTQPPEQGTVNECSTTSDASPLLARHALHRFLLSEVIRIPEDCPCSIPAEATKEVYSLCYDLDIKMEVSGVPAAVTDIEASSTEERVHIATDKHTSNHPDFEPYLPFTEPYYHKLKTYTLQLKPLNVVVANSTC